jgi:hypothetical protein
MTHDIRSLAVLGVPADVAEPLLQYVAALNELDATRRAQERVGKEHYLGERYAYYGVDPDATSGGKYLRIVMGHSPEYSQRSVHSFVEKATGKVIKSGGWAGPAKSTAKATKGQLLSKYTLSDPASFEKLLANLDPFGGYLYGAGGGR